LPFSDGHFHVENSFLTYSYKPVLSRCRSTVTSLLDTRTGHRSGLFAQTHRRRRSGENPRWSPPFSRASRRAISGPHPIPSLGTWSCAFPSQPGAAACRPPRQAPRRRNSPVAELVLDRKPARILSAVTPMVGVY